MTRDELKLVEILREVQQAVEPLRLKGHITLKTEIRDILLKYDARINKARLSDKAFSPPRPSKILRCRGVSHD